MDPLLELRGIEVEYGGVTALHKTSLSVGKGEFFCLLGPSGCGKSTTLGAVAGFLKVSSGSIFIDGREVTHLPPQKRNVGVVFQNYALFPHMTAAANVGYGLKMRGVAAGRMAARVQELLHLVRLDGKGDRFPQELSGGEQQRVAIARALAIQPPLLLLDEPLSNLDARLREEMRAELKRIQTSTGVTTIFVTHDQEEALGLGDRIAVVNKGQIEQVGTPDEIYRAPRTSFVARFIGRSNRLTGEVLSTAPGGFCVAGKTFACSLRPRVGHRRYTLYLRPEELQIGRTVEGPNAVQGIVEAVVFGGSTVTYQIATDLGPLEVCRLASDTGAFKRLEQVAVGWQPVDGALLPEADDD